MSGHYQLERTSTYQVQYNRLSLRLRRLVEVALEILEENPTEYKGQIMLLAKPDKQKFGLYRFRIPGAFIWYKLYTDEQKVTLTQVNPCR